VVPHIFTILFRRIRAFSASGNRSNIELLNEAVVTMITAGSFDLVRAFYAKRPGSPGSEGASPYLTNSLHSLLKFLFAIVATMSSSLLSPG
jgi:hypothetical protein